MGNRLVEPGSGGVGRGGKERRGPGGKRGKQFFFKNIDKKSEKYKIN